MKNPFRTFFNILFLPLKLPMYYAGCLTSFVLMAILIIAALVFGFGNNLAGGLNFLNQLTGKPRLYAPANIYVPDVARIQSFAHLTTTSYNYADVQGGQRDMPAWLAALYGDSVVMVTVGVIEAGIDVNQISAEDILFDEANNILSIQLPYPILQSCFLDENQSYIVERNTALFGVPLVNLEDSVRENALRDYRDRALEEGILIAAETEAETVMREFLGIVLNPETTLLIQFDAPLTDFLLPPSCQV